MPARKRSERLQIMLTDKELSALDDWRFGRRMPSRASAIRELLKRGLAADGFSVALQHERSKDFGLLEERKQRSARKRDGRGVADSEPTRRAASSS
jgi:hypothetical protein